MRARGPEPVAQGVGQQGAGLDLDRGLSAGEKRMLAKAKQILVSELALAERTDEVKAATILDEVLAS